MFASMNEKILQYYFFFVTSEFIKENMKQLGLINYLVYFLEIKIDTTCKYNTKSIIIATLLLLVVSKLLKIRPCINIKHVLYLDIEKARHTIDSLGT